MKDLNMEHSQLTLDQVTSGWCRNSLWTPQHLNNIPNISVIVSVKQLVNCIFFSPSTIDKTKQMEVPWLSYVDFFFFLPKWEMSWHLQKQTRLFLHFFLITLNKPKWVKCKKKKKSTEKMLLLCLHSSCNKLVIIMLFSGFVTMRVCRNHFIYNTL